MIEALKGWIISIVCTVIFVTIVELILPKGSIKKYVKLATGLLIMLVILAPIFNLISDSGAIEQKILSYTSSLSEYKKVDTKKAQEEFKNKTKETLVAGLKESISEDIKLKTGKNYSVVSIELENAKNELNFDGIKSVSLKKAEDKDKVVTVDKIEIGEGTKAENSEKDKEVLKVLEDDFGIKDSNVNFIK